MAQLVALLGEVGVVGFVGIVIAAVMILWSRVYEYSLRERMITDGHTNVVTTKQTRFVLVPKLMVAAILFYAIWRFVSQDGILNRSDLFVLSAPVYYFLYEYLKYSSAVYGMSNTELNARTGIIDKNRDFASFDRIADINDDPTLLGSILGYVDLEVFTGRDEPKVWPNCPAWFVNEFIKRYGTK